jgi:centrosomal protein CEP104
MKVPTSLGYTVVSCTSDDPTHPISSIQCASIRSPGWQSSPSPRYPIEFILDLGTSADLETLQFVSHQYKIASRVDIYIANADRQFQALGSFGFTDNARTNYAARELKSATLQGIKAHYLKISIPGCHPNSNNPQNQVGLVSINIIGRGGMPKSQAAGNVAANAFVGDALPTDMLDILERQKKEAVLREDFRKAEALKQQIERLRRSHDQIMRLHREKTEAIQREDYATAQRLKLEIDSLLNGQTQQQQQQQQQPAARKAEEPQVRAAPTRRPQPVESSPVESPAVKPQRKQGAAPVEQERPTPRQRAGPRPIPDERPIQPSSIDYGVEQPGEVPAGASDDSSEPPELSASDADKAGEVVDACSDIALRYFYSPKWAHRAKGIKMLADEICAITGNRTDLVVRYCTMLKSRMAGSQWPVFQEAVRAFQAVCTAHHIHDSELVRCFQEVKDVFMGFMRFWKPERGKVIIGFLVWLHENGCWDVLVKLLTQPLPHSNQTGLARYQLATLTEIALRNPSVPLTSLAGAEFPMLMGFLKPHFTSPDRGVKEAALGLVVILDTSNRESLNNYIDGLDPVLQNTLRDALSQAQH